MPDITESIEKLTASLQQLTAESNNQVQTQTEPEPLTLPAEELKFSPGVQAFVRRNRDYDAATRSVSVGTY